MTKKYIITIDKTQNIKEIDCILVLGAGAWGDKPSPLLEDRILKGIELYEKNIAPKLLMSGDHGQKNYDEVNVMKNYAITKNVPSSDIFMDHAGFSTYDSIYRAKHIFKAKKVIIVTQEYHLSRALYIAQKLDLEAYGVTTKENDYSGQDYRDIREFLARNKDFVKVIFKPKSTYLGEEIPLAGNGDITNDK
jgi:vancomycin permeability regulator SanA